MRIAVSATGAGTDARVDERFGRCAYFVVLDENGIVQEVINNESAALAEGAGIKTTQVLLRHKVDVVLTGRVGPKAMNALMGGGVDVYTGVEGTVAVSFERYQNGLLQPLAAPNARSHAGKTPGGRVVK